MQKMEGHQYANALDIIMGYYTIRLSPASQNMTTMVTEIGKFRYSCLPMVICAFGDILHVKVDELIVDIKGIKTYINDVLFLIKESFSNHIEQLSITFGRFRAVGLKIIAPKCSFGLK